MIVRGQDVGLWHPLPGAGKTTLAIRIATDPRVEATYPDGTLWITLGKAPARIQEQLRAWGSFAGMSTVELDGVDDLQALRQEYATRLATEDSDRTR